MGGIAQTCQPSTMEVEVGRSEIQGTQGKPGLHKTLSKIQKLKKEKTKKGVRERMKEGSYHKLRDC